MVILGLSRPAKGAHGVLPMFHILSWGWLHRCLHNVKWLGLHKPALSPHPRPGQPCGTLWPGTWSEVRHPVFGL